METTIMVYWSINSEAFTSLFEKLPQNGITLLCLIVGDGISRSWSFF